MRVPQQREKRKALQRKRRIEYPECEYFFAGGQRGVTSELQASYVWWKVEGLEAMINPVK
jgi:hypothetical protein